MANKPSETYVLDLSNKSLTTVPKSILKYTNLKELNLSNNQLTELPKFLIELEHLEILNLRKNKIKEAPSSISSLKHLKSLSLSENEIEKLPETYSRLSQLEKFDFGDNPLTEFPQWLGKLFMLKYLGIFCLNLEQLPEVVTQLKYLEEISLDTNKITTLPQNIDKLRHLKSLWAEDNKFETIPESIGNLKNLTVFSFNISKLKYLPESIGNLKNLESISISENNLQELPESIGSLKKLTFLDISYNEIKTLPKSFVRLNIAELDVWFDGNPYSQATQNQIKRLFPNVDEYEINIEALKEYEEKIKAERAEIVKNQKPESNGVLASFIMFLLFIVFPVFIAVLVASKKDPLDAAREKAYDNYNEAVEIYQKNHEKVLKNNPSIYIYTNDTTNLKTALHPNIEFYTNEYAPSFTNVQGEADDLNSFIADKSLGYHVVLNNNRVKLIQANVFDSVIPEHAMKKYSLLVDYKLNDKEIERNRKRKNKYSYLQPKDNDTLYDSHRLTLTSKELAEKKISSGLKRLT